MDTQRQMESIHPPREPPVMTAPTIAPEPIPQSESDQGCEPATIVGVLVKLKTEDCLIDWDTEVMLPTLPHPESSILSSSVPSSSLVHPSIMTVNYCFRSHLASLSPLLYKSQLVLQPSPASAVCLQLFAFLCNALQCGHVLSCCA